MSVSAPMIAWMKAIGQGKQLKQIIGKLKETFHYGRLVVYVKFIGL